MKNYLTSHILLRAGLGFVFLYAGIASFLQPDIWISFVPAWVEDLAIARDTALYLHAMADIALGVLFLLGKWQKWVGLIGFVTLFLIVFVNGTELLLVTFRDVGLAFAALAYGLKE